MAKIDFNFTQLFLWNRYYDPSTGRFITEDPVKDGSNWYVYCGNNPMRYVDPSGLAPGDIFETDDLAAQDWSMHFNAPSIALYKEFGGIIYKDENGFYWDNVFIGQDKEVFWAIPEVRKGVAFIHSHSGGKPTLTDIMSMADKSGAKKCQRPLYMVDSGGQLHVYDPTQENVKDRVQKKVADGLPVDCKYTDMAESSKRMKEYFSETGYHDITEYNFGYIADYYNKMYMEGVRYDNK